MMKDDSIGVYSITNRSNGKVYVGSSSRSIKTRWCVHRHALVRGIHHSKHLQRAWNKHGESGFVFSVIHVCQKGECIKLEQEYINKLMSADPKFGYNVDPTAGSRAGFKMSKKQRAFLSHYCKVNNSAQRMHTPECRAKSSASQKGRKLSKEQCAQMSRFMKDAWANKAPFLTGPGPNKGKKFSDEVRIKMSIAAKKVIKTEAWGRKIGDAHKILWAKNRDEILAKMAKTRALLGPQWQAARNKKISDGRKNYWIQWRQDRGITHSFEEARETNRLRAERGLLPLLYPRDFTTPIAAKINQA